MKTQLTFLVWYLDLVCGDHELHCYKENSLCWDFLLARHNLADVSNLFLDSFYLWMLLIVVFSSYSNQFFVVAMWTNNCHFAEWNLCINHKKNLGLIFFNIFFYDLDKFNNGESGRRRSRVLEKEELCVLIKFLGVHSNMVLIICNIR